MNKVADGGDLTLLLLLGIVKDQPVAVLLGQSLLHAGSVGVAPVAFRAHLRKTHHDGILIGVGGGSRDRGAAGEGEDKEQQKTKDGSLHLEYSSFSGMRVWGSRTDTVEPLPT